MNIKNILTAKNAVMVLGAGAYLHETYKLGVLKSNEGAKIRLASLADNYVDTLKSDEVSPTATSAKDAYFSFLMDQDLSEYRGKIGGFFNGVFTSLKRNLIPITLLAATFFTRKSKLAAKLKMNYLLPIAFTAYAVKQFIINPLSLKGTNYLSKD